MSVSSRVSLGPHFILTSLLTAVYCKGCKYIEEFYLCCALGRIFMEFWRRHVDVNWDFINTNISGTCSIFWYDRNDFAFPVQQMVSFRRLIRQSCIAKVSNFWGKRCETFTRKKNPKHSSFPLSIRLQSKIEKASDPSFDRSSISESRARILKDDTSNNNVLLDPRTPSIPTLLSRTNIYPVDKKEQTAGISIFGWRESIRPAIKQRAFPFLRD